MKNIKVYMLSFLVIVFISAFFSGCNNDSSGSSQTSAMTVKLSDVPDDYKEINIDVRGTMIKKNLNPDNEGWVSLVVILG